MKAIFPLCLFLATVSVSPAQRAAQNPDDDSDPHAAESAVNLNLPPSFQASILREKDGRTIPLNGVFLFKVDAGRIIFADNAQGARFEALEPATIKFMSLDLPGDLTLALQKYEDGDYPAALPLLEKAITRYAALRALPGSPVARAEIYRLDSLRRTKKFDALREALAIAKPENYDDFGKAYLMVLPAWDAYSTRDWKRIEVLTRDIDSVAAGTPAAELAFLRGEALARLDRKPEALAEYHRAMIMDFTRSRELFGDAALAALNVYNDDPQVNDFFERFGGPDYNPDASYVVPAKAAASLAWMVSTLKPGGRTLAASHQKFLEAYENFQKAESKDDAGKSEEGATKAAPAAASPAE
jgi:tetratricopeptide (TPR) repeat protein